jgi:Ca2+-transporting ATPase
MKKIWHALEAGEVLKCFGVDVKRGRTELECQKLKEQFGPNTLPEQKRRQVLEIFLRQFLSPLIYLLMIASVIAFSIGDYKDAMVIIVVVILNSLVSAIQEGRAEASLAALRRLTKLKAKILRDGQLLEVDASELVPGDIYHLSAGDGVPTDGRLVDANGLQVSEASLTGESMPVSKISQTLPADTILPDRVNMVYAGTYITSGRATVVAVSTGSHNELGKIAAMAGKTTQVKTSLETRIHNFGKTVAWASVAVFLVAFILGLLHGMKISEIFMIAVSQMVSIVPEGLPVAMTIALAVGVQRMANRRTIVRKLSAVESLGATTVICTDKTGTLTKNEMTVVEIALPGTPTRRFKITGTGYAPTGEFIDDVSGQVQASLELANDLKFQKLMAAAVCCNDSHLMAPVTGSDLWRITGDPTEAALLVCAQKSGVEYRALKAANPRVAELPFDPNFKMMATEHLDGERSLVYLKGAPEAIFAKCSFNDEGEKKLDEFKQLANQMASKALRVLAFGIVNDAKISADKGFDDFYGRIECLGLMAQIDPPRDEVKSAIAECARAGIRPMMITGDHKATAVAIAQQLGIADDPEQALSGSEMELLSDEQLSNKLDQISVFARVHPEQKLRIIRSLQARGHVVAMTGDGVNDSPALVQADVGVAMGMTGTEVAKEASKIIITDDNFATIVAAVAEGRLVYRNIKKLLLFLFVTSIDELMVLFLALLFGFHAPLAAVQILWLNLVSESALTVSLIMEPMEEQDMRRPPIPAGDPLLDKDMLKRMPFMIAASVISTFGWFLARSYSGVPVDVVQTETFTVLVVCQWFNLLNCRSSSRPALSWSLLSNPWLVGGLIIANLLHGLVIYWKPLGEFFHTAPISAGNFFAIGLVASLVLWVEDARKFYVRRSLTI